MKVGRSVSIRKSGYPVVLNEAKERNMAKRDCIAMLLAGGQGSRLGALTKDTAKPAVSFGGKYRIIDFALSNCANSGIDAVGVLTQYRPYVLHSYVGSGDAWNLDVIGSGVSILPPYVTQRGGSWYQGTADAVARNLGWIEQHPSDHVLILSGDQLYRMDYHAMLENHKRHNADLTIAVMPVPWEEASRFGIITQDEDERIVKFSEKPAEPDSNLASMGIYVFNTEVLFDSLRADIDDPNSDHDFGKNIIPTLLDAGKRLYTFEFNGYWRDMGTIESYHSANMELLGSNPEFDLFDAKAPIMSNASTRPPHFVGADASISDCLIGNGAVINGLVSHSVISTDAQVGAGAVVKDAVLLPGAIVEDRAQVHRAIIGEGARVLSGTAVGSSDEGQPIAVVGNGEVAGGE